MLQEKKTIIRIHNALGSLMLSIFLLISLFFSTYLFKFIEINFYVFLFLRLLLIAFNMIAIIKFLNYILIKSKLKKIFKKIILFFFSLLFIFLLLESILMFSPRSMHCDESLPKRIWRKCYNKPINELGYRDKNITLSRLKNTTKIIVLGDSYAEGSGLKTIAQRFSNLLENMLPSSYIVLNFGKGGSDTRDELNRLLQSPIKPDILIYQYFINDIDYLIQPSVDELKRELFSYKNIHPIFTPLIRYSYVCNFIYWKLYPQEDIIYLNAIISAWNNKKIRETHISDIESIIAYCNKNNISLIAVLFPSRTNYNEKIMNKINNFILSSVEEPFKKKNVPILNLTELLNSMPLSKCVVDYNDQHPSALVNSLVAKKLYMILKNEDILKEKK